MPYSSGADWKVELVGSGGGTVGVEGVVADGGAAGSTKPVVVGGVDGSSNVQTFLTDTSGRQVVVGAVAAGVSSSGINPVVMGMVDGGALVRAPFGDVISADGASGAAFMLRTTNFPLVFNGTTWDRVRSATAASNTTGTGLPGVGNLVHDGTNYQLWKQAVGTGAAQTPTGVPLVGVGLAVSSTDLRTWEDANQVDGSGLTGIGSIVPFLYNGATADKQRNNTEGTTVTRSGATTSLTGTDTTNYNARGIIIYLNVTSNPGGAETLTINLQAKDEAGADGYVTIATSGALYGAGTTGLQILMCYPGAAETGAVSDMVTQALPVPRTFRIGVAHSASGAWTYTLAHTLML